MNNIDKSTCYGCFNCESKCPHNAISIKYNTEGFYEPSVDYTKCKHCNLCKKYCPINSNKIDNMFNTNFQQRFYIGYCKNRTTLNNSSSGGIFFLIAKSIIDTNGYVCGAGFRDGILQHFLVNTIEDISVLQGSKYLQSKIGTTFIEIEKLLKQDKLVLFSGTPCQVASLKLFLNKSYSNLITIDLICHGTPSPQLFYNYVDEIFQKKTFIENCTFRDKSAGWHKPKLVLSTNNGLYSNFMSEDLFCKAFWGNIILNATCSNCMFAQTARIGDITLGDAWNAQYLFRDFENKMGTSLILLNSHKGYNIFKKLKSHIIAKQITKKEAICGNDALERPFMSHVNRTSFFSKYELHDTSLKTLLQESLDISKNVAILNFSFENSNFGAILTAFALNKFINQNGYNAYNIDYTPVWYKEEPNTYFKTFKDRYIPHTSKCHDFKDLQSLNNQFSTFVVGSDQVFRPKFASDKDGIYYLNFVKNSKNKISCAASFGVNFWEGDKITKQKIRYYLSKFNFISVREDSGKSIIKDIINRDVTHLLDPVFFLDIQDYLSFINNKKPNDDCVAYILHERTRTKILEQYSFIKNIRYNLSINEWLENIYNSQLIITDSFHCICFCLLFNKKFVVIVNKQCPSERIESLFRMFKLPNKILYDDMKLSWELINNNIINPNNIQQYIEELRNKHKNIFINAVKNPIKKDSTELNINLKKLKTIKHKIKILRFFSLGKKRKEYNNRLKRIEAIRHIIFSEKNNN